MGMSLADYDFKKIFLFILYTLIIVAGLSGSAAGIYYYNKYQITEKRFREAAVVSQQDVQALVEKVGKLIKLPDDELPTVATVTDLERLKNQPFFAQAKVGDKVLLYPQAKKAILYDPIDNVIIEVGPLVIPTITPFEASSTESGTIAFGDEERVSGIDTTGTINQPLKIAIYNGTTTASLLNDFGNELTGKIKNAIVTIKSNSQKRDYAKTVVIDLTGKNKLATENIAKTLNLEVAALPSDENAPEGNDLLIILGLDRL